MSKNSVTKKLITTLALLTCLCGIGTLSVHAAPKAVSFNNNSKKITMFTTQRKQLKIKLSGKYKKSDVVYSSSNKKVATVNKKGVVKALKKGNITIYAQIKGTSKKAKCKVKVFKNVKSIKVVGRKKHYYVGQQYQLNYKTTFFNKNFFPVINVFSTIKCITYNANRNHKLHLISHIWSFHIAFNSSSVYF